MPLQRVNWSCVNCNRKVRIDCLSISCMFFFCGSEEWKQMEKRNYKELSLDAEKLADAIRKRIAFYGHMAQLNL